jgi:hypothetical protein
MSPQWKIKNMGRGRGHRRGMKTGSHMQENKHQPNYWD